MKTIPFTAPTAAVPTTSVPLDFRLIPVGSGAHVESTPNIPPGATPDGNVVFKSKVALLPTDSVGTIGTQAAVAGGGTGAGGDEDGRGGAAGVRPIGAEL